MEEQVGARIFYQIFGLKRVGGVAQLGEHLPCKQGVKSSNLSISMKIMKRVAEPDWQMQTARTCAQTDADDRQEMDIRRISMNE